MPHTPARPKRRSTKGRDVTSSTRQSGSAPRSVAPAPATPSEPSPEHWRYLEAVTDLLESGEDFTTRALASRLGMSSEDLWKFRYERPDVTQWASDQLGANARAMVGPLLRRVAQFAQAGSTEHADLLLRVASRAWSVVAVRGTGGQAGPLIVNVVVGEGQGGA